MSDYTSFLGINSLFNTARIFTQTFSWQFGERFLLPIRDVDGSFFSVTVTAMALNRSEPSPDQSARVDER